MPIGKYTLWKHFWKIEGRIVTKSFSQNLELNIITCYVFHNKNISKIILYNAKKLGRIIFMISEKNLMQHNVFLCKEKCLVSVLQKILHVTLYVHTNRTFAVPPKNDKFDLYIKIFELFITFFLYRNNLWFFWSKVKFRYSFEICRIINYFVPCHILISLGATVLSICSVVHTQDNET